MYTTNIIEGVNRQFRKVTKTKSTFPSDESLLKILYLASQNIMKKWTVRYRDWDSIYNQLSIYFDNRPRRSTSLVPLTARETTASRCRA